MSTRKSTDRTDMPEQPLAIPLSAVCNIIDKLREYESLNLLNETDNEQDDEANPLENEDVESVSEHENQCEFDPLLQELHAYIDGLAADQQIDLVALMWLGRDNNSASDWPSLREEALRGHNARTTSYLLGSPMAADFLEEGLSTLGLSCEPPGIESTQA